MKLFYSSTSPFVRKVNVVAIETGLDSRIEWQQTNPWQAEENLVTDNPLSKIPTLVMDNGEVIYGSQLICEYLDGLHSGKKMIPADDSRWSILRLQSLADGILEAGILRFMERKREPSLQSPEWDTMQKSVIQRGLDYLESNVSQLEVDLNLGIITVGVMLGWLDFRLGSEDWRSSHPKLAKWYEGFEKKESMQATIPFE